MAISDELSGSEREGGYPRADFLRRAAAVGLAFPLAELLGAGAAKAAVTRQAETGVAALTKPPVLESLFTLSNIYYKAYSSGAQQAAQQLGLKLDVHVDAAIDGQTSTIQDAPTRGDKTLFVMAESEATQPALLRLAQQLNLPAVSNHTQALWQATPYDVGPDYVAFHAINGSKAFAATAAAAFRQLGGKGNVLYITGIPGATPDTDRTLGFNSALKKFPGIKLLEQRSGNWNRVDAAPVIDNLLTRYPHVDAIICSNDEEAIAAAASLQQHGRKALVTGFDGVPEMLNLISQGRAFATFAQHPGWIGGFSVVRLFDYANGWRPTPLERMMFFGGFVVDSPKAATLYNKITYGKALPYSFKKMSRVLHPRDWDAQNILTPIDLNGFWKAKPRPAGYQFPAAYTAARKGGGAGKLAATYASHFKSDPLAAVRKATTSGGEIIT